MNELDSGFVDGDGPEFSGWTTYNFEVAAHHTYIADGIRVHNQSLIVTVAGRLTRGDINELGRKIAERTEQERTEASTRDPRGPDQWRSQLFSLFSMHIEGSLLAVVMGKGPSERVFDDFAGLMKSSSGSEYISRCMEANSKLRSWQKIVFEDLVGYFCTYKSKIKVQDWGRSLLNWKDA